MAETGDHLWSFMPIVRWLPRYERGWILPDATAGITLAAYAIPVSLAYAALAGLPPESGLYCYLVAGTGYALFGSSRHLAIGPTSAISLLIGRLRKMKYGPPPNLPTARKGACHGAHHHEEDVKTERDQGHSTYRQTRR